MGLLKALRFLTAPQKYACRDFDFLDALWVGLASPVLFFRFS